MDVELPDGTIIEDVPDNITRAELYGRLKAKGYDVSGLGPAPTVDLAVKQPPQQTIKQAPALPKEDSWSIKSLLTASPAKMLYDEVRKRVEGGYILKPDEETAVRQTLQSAASGPLMGVVQLGAEATGNTALANKIAQNRREGNIAGALLQAEALLSGRALPQIATVGKQMLALGGMGAGYGFLSPNEDMQARLRDASISGGVGAVVPVVGRAATYLTPKLRGLIDSLSAVFTSGGRVTVGHKMVLDQLSAPERATVLRTLQERGIDTSEIGSALTSAEALAKRRIGETVKSPTGAGIAALEQAVSQRAGGEVLREAAAQRAGNAQQMVDTLSGGRGAAVDPLLGVSADDAAIAAARQARGAVAQRLYPSGNVPGDERLNEIMSRPGVQTAMGIEERSAANVPRPTQVGRDVPASSQPVSVFNEWQLGPYTTQTPAQFASYPIKTLQNRYRLMDKEITRLMKTGVSVDETRAYELLKAKNDLGAWLADASPAWAAANRAYAFQSVPVRQMEVGAALKQKMQQSPDAFLKATETLPAQERLIRSATGRPNQQLSSVMNLGQMSKIAGLREEAQITNEVEKLRSLVQPQMKDQDAFQLPNLLNVWVAVANKVARGTAAATVDEVTRAAADILRHPNKLRMLLAEEARKSAAAAAPAPVRPLAAPALLTGGLMTGNRE